MCWHYTRLLTQVYGLDGLGRDVPVGVGSCLVPPIGGVYVMDVDTFVPISSSVLNDWLSWILV